MDSSGKFNPRPCGCKGIRRCLLCEGDFTDDIASGESMCSFVFCTHCSVAFHADVEEYEAKDCSWHRKLGNVPSMPFPGVTIFTEFITTEMEDHLVKEIETRPWAPSQSGRLKQDYGPKCNFKKRKLKVDAFTGFPSYLEPIVVKFASTPLLANYHTAEQCNLDYHPSRGSAIDPHFDDFWVWGERLLTLSLLSLTFLTMSLPRGENAGPKVEAEEKVELARRRREEAENTWRELMERIASGKEGSVVEETNGASTTDGGGFASTSQRTIPASTPSSIVRVHLPMPPRSLMALYGAARDTWVHEVRRCDVKERRIAIAFRELAEEFLPGGKSEEVGKLVLERAVRFDGVSRIEC